LVLLKGSQVDGLDHIARNWRAKTVRAPSQDGPRPAETAVALPAIDRSDWRLIVGIGNPDPELAHTPHNVGHRALDALASQLGVAWTSEEDMTIADAVVEHRHLRLLTIPPAAPHPRHLRLLKIATPVNLTGAALQVIASRLGVPPERCLVVLDDMDL